MCYSRCPYAYLYIGGNHVACTTGVTHDPSKPQRLLCIVAPCILAPCPRRMLGVLSPRPVAPSAQVETPPTQACRTAADRVFTAAIATPVLVAAAAIAYKLRRPPPAELERRGVLGDPETGVALEPTETGIAPDRDSKVGL